MKVLTIKEWINDFTKEIHCKRFIIEINSNGFYYGYNMVKDFTTEIHCKGFIIEINFNGFYYGHNMVKDFMIEIHRKSKRQR